MPRLKNIDPTTDTGAGADLLNGPLKEKQINIFKGLAAHAPVLQAFIAKGTGLSEDDCVNIRKRQSDDTKMQALIDFTAETLDTNGNVSDKTLTAFMDAGFNTEAAIEVVAGISVMTFTSFYNHINDTVVDFPEAVSV
jgi:alkylhydroperoxidase family enzyme